MFDHGFIEVHDANQNNLQHVNVKIPKVRLVFSSADQVQASLL